MNKQVSRPQAMVFCGIDVSAASLSVALIEPSGGLTQREFANCASGHRALLAWLAQCSDRVRVSLEATGIYSLDLALALDASGTVELAVLNPKLVNRFAQTLRRSKTDAADAVVLAEYSQRMPFTRWQRPQAKPSSVAHRGTLHRVAGCGAVRVEEPFAHSRTDQHHSARDAGRLAAGAGQLRAACGEDATRGAPAGACRGRPVGAVPVADQRSRYCAGQRHPNPERAGFAGADNERAPVGGIERT